MKGDRHAAFAGIVYWFENEIKGLIDLGLNRAKFLHEVTWTWQRSDHPGLSGPIPNAPSWTWLSQESLVIAPIEIGSEVPSSSDISILDLDVCWTGEPLTSGIASTKLAITGYTAKVGFRSSVMEPGSSRSRNIAAYDMARTERSNSCTCIFDENQSR